MHTWSNIGFVSWIALGLAAAQVSALAGSLDGKTFVGKNGLMGEEKAESEDTVIFQDGTFISTGCQEWGFGSGAYMERKEGKKTHFVADTYSDEWGRIIWMGTMVDDHVDATYVWFAKDKTDTPEQVKWLRADAKK